MELKDLNVILPPNKLDGGQADPESQYYFSWEQPFEKERKVVSLISPIDGNF